MPEWLTPHITFFRASGHIDGEAWQQLLDVWVVHEVRNVVSTYSDVGTLTTTQLWFKITNHLVNRDTKTYRLSILPALLNGLSEPELTVLCRQSGMVVCMARAGLGGGMQFNR